jgi:hypothetical protein
MASIFVSHSKNDPNLDFFHRGFSTTGVKGIFMEYEEMTKPAWTLIKQNVSYSDAVFVLLSKAVKDKEYTQNWIAFEVGLACHANKNVWVFERKDDQINYAVPYFTHYVLYHPEVVDNFPYVKRIIGGHGVVSDFGGAGKCPSCGIEYRFCTKADDWFCPCCRSITKWQVRPY